ncbi:hypothetical protein PHYSODRAFT_325897 [Phytophthora sojae]|uniref:NADP-dependent oxidoreductase domain-containing protein n=1 Tax=Phytophthora sojae (strain P6497) TaxID=1094619 RepID=G4YTT7_PHYSP|nr:hypothetical protein PHYSODRAFT_325897 [Phytophthora sojae]EGZ24823.1 hypothetical protein PHYSODRAFT_325897 [Phytophthora sojae]|eukprot:XP_009520111.1 hypothetical protein PHYSODRAFT_325897 [Phytophthora sojae]
MGLDYVDVIFCHHPEPCTPIEETVRAMNFILAKGRALYWGTSNWSASSVLEACEIADRLGLVRPIVEQSQYNIFARDRVEYELTPLFKRYGFGVTAWSPLAFGTLLGKYSANVPEGSCFTMEAIQKSMFGGETFTKNVAKADKLKSIAAKLGCSLAQMSIAWCVTNEHVATVLIGASRSLQLEENLKALAFVDKITPEVKAEIDAIVEYVPSQQWVDHLQDVRLRHL